MVTWPGYHHCPQEDIKEHVTPAELQAGKCKGCHRARDHLPDRDRDRDEEAIEVVPAERRGLKRIDIVVNMKCFGNQTGGYTRISGRSFNDVRTIQRKGATVISASAVHHQVERHWSRWPLYFAGSFHHHAP